jgi:hypothetical protein
MQESFIVFRELRSGEFKLTVENKAPPGLRNRRVRLDQASMAFLEACWVEQGCEGYLSAIAQKTFDSARGLEVNYVVSRIEALFRHRHDKDPAMRSVVSAVTLTAKLLALTVERKEARHEPVSR